MKFIFMLLGVGVLVPWNAFISAVPYFQSRICSIPGASEHFELWLGLTFNFCSVLSLGLLLLGPWIREQLLDLGVGRRGGGQQRRSSIHEEISTASEEEGNNHYHDGNEKSQNHSFWLVTIPLCCYLAVFVVTDMLVAIKNIEPAAFLTYTFFGIIILGIAGAFCQAGIVAASSVFPSSIGINPFVSGQAVGGVAVSAANLLSAIAEDPNKFWNQHCAAVNSSDSTSSRTFFTDTQQIANFSSTTSTAYSILLVEEDNTTMLGDTNNCLPYDKFDASVFYYFLVGALVSLACVIGFTIIDRHARRLQYREDYETVDGPILASSEQDEFHDEPSQHSRIGLELRPSTSRATLTLQGAISMDNTGPIQRNEAVALSEPDGLFQRFQSSGSGNGEINEMMSNASDTSDSVFHAVRGPAFTIFATFFVTLSLFPGWTSLLKSVHQCQSRDRLANDLVTPMTFVVFNVGDLIGRLLAERLPTGNLQTLPRNLVMATFLRCLFFPLLLVCFGGSSQREHNLQIQSDLYSILIQTLFAVTNGMLISLAFMTAPRLIPSEEKSQERSSKILTFAVYFGLLSGSLFSFPLSSVAF